MNVLSKKDVIDVDHPGERLLSLDNEPRANSSSGGTDYLVETDSHCSKGELSRQNDLESSSCEENEIQKEHRTVIDIFLPIFNTTLDHAGVSNALGHYWQQPFLRT